jgi:hypothetical protein
MNRTRRITLTVRCAACTLWAALLTVAGLWVIFTIPDQWPIFEPVCVYGGASLVGAGQFLFMMLVADRLFPRASRRFVRPLEAGAFLVFAAGLVLGLRLLSVGQPG